MKLERKFFKFGGYLEKDIDFDVIDWILEMREYIRGMILKDRYIDFVMDYFIGNVKVEICLYLVE